MAKVSNSESFIATTNAGAQHVAEDFKNYTASPLLTQITIKAEGFDIYDIYPQTVPDVFASRPITIFGKCRGTPKGKLIVSGYQGKEKISQEFKVSDGNLSKKI